MECAGSTALSNTPAKSSKCGVTRSKSENLQDNGGYTSGGGIFLDNITVDVSTLPEPATLGLVGAFGGVILFIRRRFMI